VNTTNGDERAGAEEAGALDGVGVRTELTCPGCGGAIWELESDGVPVLRCHVGHAYGLDSFEFEQSLALESALWTAVRALEEKQILITRLGEQAQREGRDRSASVFLERAEGLQRQADGLRSLVESVMTVGDAASVSVSGGGSVPS
jgi:two-component system chemotaxis response regulator CheB